MNINIGHTICRSFSGSLSSLNTPAPFLSTHLVKKRHKDEDEETEHHSWQLSRRPLPRTNRSVAYLSSSLKYQHISDSFTFSLSHKQQIKNGSLADLLPQAPTHQITAQRLLTAMMAYLAICQQSDVHRQFKSRVPRVTLRAAGLGSNKQIYKFGRPLAAKIPNRRNFSTNAAGAGKINQQTQQNRTLKSQPNTDTDGGYEGVSSAKLPAKTRLYTIGCGFSKDHNPQKRITSDYCIGCTPEDRNFGEDAAFIAETEHADVMGVSDGVGGWRNHGVDPSLFSGTLARNLKNMVEDPRFDVKQPVQLLSRAYNELYRVPDLIGSATACIATFDRRSQKLYTANLGDSGFMVIRDGKIVSRSTPQTHSFNAPFQLSKVPPNQQRTSFGDKPAQSDYSEFQCQHGDIIILATDGMFDNVYDQHVVDLLKQLDLGTPKDLFKGVPTQTTETDSGTDCEDTEDATNRISVVPSIIQAAVSNMVAYTRYRAHQKDYMSPFAMEYNQTKRAHVTGGKVDDITILVSIVGPKVG